MHTTTHSISFWQSCWDMSLAFCPYLLLGSLIAGVLHYLLPVGWIHKHLSGSWGVVKAVLLGIPLPLCSCSVIPTGLGLRKQGADLGSSVGFLISTPQTGIDSIAVSAGMLGWPFAWLKVLAALVCGLLGGWWTQLWVKQTDHISDVTSCATSDKNKPAYKIITEHAMSILQPIWGWIVVGVLISAGIQSLVPNDLLPYIEQQHTAWVLPMVLLFSLPLYVCATASVPIAAALVSKGLSLGAALVFLMAGPASNAATMGAIYKELGARVLIIYLSTLIIGSFAFAILATPYLQESIPTLTPTHVHEHSYIAILCTGLCALIFLSFASQSLRHAIKQIRAKSMKSTHQADQSTLTYAVEGMSCGGCVRKLEHVLSECNGIEQWTVSRNPDQVVVIGTHSSQTLITKIKTIGFHASLKKNESFTE